MLNDLQQDLVIGQTFDMELTFDSGLVMPVKVTVRED
jgi:hypothetical protein